MKKMDCQCHCVSLRCWWFGVLGRYQVAYDLWYPYACISKDNDAALKQATVSNIDVHVADCPDLQQNVHQKELFHLRNLVVRITVFRVNARDVNNESELLEHDQELSRNRKSKHWMIQISNDVHLLNQVSKVRRKDEPLRSI